MRVVMIMQIGLFTSCKLWEKKIALKMLRAVYVKSQLRGMNISVEKYLYNAEW